MILTIMTIQIVFQQEIVIGFIYSGNCYLRINTFWLREQESHEDLKENSKIDVWKYDLYESQAYESWLYGSRGTSSKREFRNGRLTQGDIELSQWPWASHLVS